MSRLDDIPPPKKNSISLIDDIPPPKKETSIGQTILDQAVNAMGFGLLPQAEGLARGVIAKVGGKDFTPAYVQARDEMTKRLEQQREQSPVVSTLSSVAGGMTPGGLIAGVGKGAVKAATSAGIGGLLQAPETKEGELPFENIGENLEKRAMQAGTGAVVGGGLGLIGKGLSAVGPGRASRVLEKEVSEEIAPVIERETLEVAMPKIRPRLSTTAEQQALANAKEVAESGIEGMRSKLSQLPDTLTERPTRKAFLEAEKNLPFKPTFPADKADEAILSNRAKELTLKALRERPDVAEDFAKRANVRRNETLLNLEQFGTKVAGKNVQGDKLASGEAFLERVGDAYKGLKTELGPKFEAFQSVPILPERMANDFAEMAANKTLTMQEAPILKQAMEALSDPDLNVKKIQEIREFLRNSIDSANPQRFKNISRLRSQMLDYLEEAIPAQAKKSGIEVDNVRDVFTRYAKNERMRDVLEDTLGVNFRELQASSPDQVFSKIFSNVKNIRAIKEQLGENSARELAGDLIASMKEPGALGEVSSSGFARAVAKNRNVLKQVLSEEEIKQLDSMASYLRGVDQIAASSNPSGTAGKLGVMEGVSALEAATQPVGLISRTIDRLGGDKLKEYYATKELEGLLGANASTQPGLIEALARRAASPGAGGVLPTLMRQEQSKR